MMKNTVENSTKNDFIHLFVSLPTNDVCSLRDLSTKLLIHQVKSKIELRVGIPGDLIHLYFMNNELADPKTLQDYKLKHGCILRVRLHKTWLRLFIACSKGDTFEVFQNGVQAISDDTSNDFDAELWNKLVIKRATFALFMATYHGYLSLMLELLNSSAADINGCTIFGRTALHIAAFQGFVGCVSLLLSEGAESSELDVFGKTPLQLAHVNRHVYCQKRLYMHQTSGNGDEKSRAAKADERRPKTAPHQMMKNFQRNQRTKKNARKEASVESFAISIPSKGPPIPPQNHTNPSPSYDLPVMKIIELTKTHHSEDEISPQDPIVRAQAAPLRREGSGTPTHSSTSRGIRGIDAILRTSQDDVVGEYHNIDESIADIKFTTLKLSLPREENISTDFQTKPTEVKTSGPPSKKILGFALKAEENRSKEKQTNESDKQNEKPVTPGTDCNLIAEQDYQDEKLWTSASNSFSDSNYQLNDRLWTPLAFDNVIENSKSAPSHRKVAPSLSYDAWLERKRQCAKEEKNDQPVSASENLRSKVGRELDVAAFQKWLEGKKKFRKSSKSETIENHRAGSGVSFEEWLRQKRQQLNESLVECQGPITEKAHLKPKQANLGGKTFSEWLTEKRKLCQTNGENLKTNNKRSKCHSGKTFREWLKGKHDEKQEQVDLQENLASLELQNKAVLEEQRKLNPRVKTFDQWFEEKQAQSIIEFIQSKNVPQESGLLKSKTKFPEDACLVYDMWLASKNMEELGREEKLYEEMVEKWRRKEQQRLRIRRSILSKLNQAKKDK